LSVEYEENGDAVFGDMNINKKGQIGNFAWLIYATVLIMIALTILPMINSRVRTSSIEAAVDFLTGSGYAVFAAGEYDDIMTLLNSIDAKADAAVTAAETAASKVDLFNSAEVYLFPATTNLTCSLAAGNTNVWSAWTEVVDSGATALSSSFAVNPGFVSDMLFFLPSDAADGYSKVFSGEHHSGHLRTGMLHMS